MVASAAVEPSLAACGVKAAVSAGSLGVSEPEVVGFALGAGAGAVAAKKTGGEVKLTAGSVLTVTTQNSFEVKP